ncbi:MAG: acylphosphatase [Phycisphaerae bacterium]|jgi:acylphosphatase|nr:acylphosphatase [Phycisphaerae bacterium]
MAEEQRIIRFAGSVQGVGFRFTTCRLAGSFDVTGSVRNCPDGSVECIVEGTPDEIDAFLQAMEDRMGHFIRDRTQVSAPYTGRFHGFSVVY